MDFTFTEDQQALRDSVSRFLMVEAVPEKLREIWQTGSGRSAELRAKLADLGMSVAPPNRPEEFAALIRQELAHWGKFVKTSGIKPN